MILIQQKVRVRGCHFEESEKSKQRKYLVRVQPDSVAGTSNITEKFGFHFSEMYVTFHLNVCKV